MTADLVLPQRATWRDAETEEIGQLATVWAVLNLLEGPHCENEQIGEASFARARLMIRLSESGLDQVDLFEHVADSVEGENWHALGIALCLRDAPEPEARLHDEGDPLG